MPVYEYYCLDCHQSFDTLRPMSQSDAPIRCRDCESEKTQRVLSMFAAQSSHANDVTQLLGGGGCECGGACACGHHHN